MKFLLGFFIVISMNNLFGSTNYVKPKFDNYYSDISLYINLDSNKCNIQNRGIFEVCYNSKLNRVESGWAIINSELIDKGNIQARPNFYKDKEVFTLAPSQIKSPIHKGHTFVTDSDFDFDINILKLTYNMLNVLPMLDKTNVGAWRKVELRGRLLALQVGEILSITKIKYTEDSRFGIPAGHFPVAFYRIYLGEDIQECYETQNIGVTGITLSEQEISCETLIQ